MPTTILKTKLSGGTNGRNIKVVATATPGTLIHTATNAANTVDELFLWAANTDSSDRKLTIELGGTTSPDDLIEFTVPLEDGLYLIVPGLILDGAVVVRAFAAAANVIVVNGYVNRITQT